MIKIEFIGASAYEKTISNFKYCSYELNYSFTVYFLRCQKYDWNYGCSDNLRFYIYLIKQMFAAAMCLIIRVYNEFVKDN